MIFFLYPDKPESEDDTLMRNQLEILAPKLKQAGAEAVHLVGRDPRWQRVPGLYRDGIHPSPAGMAALAGIIADQIERRGPR